MKQNGTTKPGDRYGKMTVGEQFKSRKYGKFNYVVWLCHCDCGNSKWVKGCNLRAGRCNSCGCARQENKNWGQKPIARNSKYFFQSWLNIWQRKSVKRRDLEFSLTLTDLDNLYDNQGGVCYYTGQPLILATGSKFCYAESNISIDRIDNAKGYTVDNVVLCCKMVNVCRNVLTQSEFIAMAHDIAKKHKRPDTVEHQDVCYDDTQTDNPSDSAICLSE